MCSWHSLLNTGNKLRITVNSLFYIILISTIVSPRTGFSSWRVEKVIKYKNRIMLLIADVFLINISIILALFVRFEGAVDGQFIQYVQVYRENFILITVVKILIFYYFKLYSSIWKYASVEELNKIVSAAIAGNALMVLIFVLKQESMPRSIYILAILFDMALIGGVRFSLRSIGSLYHGVSRKSKNQKRVMVVGAGDAGVMVIKEYRNHYGLNSIPVVFIDDNKSKQGLVIGGIHVAGTRKDIPRIVEKYSIDEIVIAIPSASKKDIAEIVGISKKTKAKLKILPGIYELIDGVVSINSIREVQIEDLLGREEIVTNIDEISKYIKDKVVLVTGGGGSIGSELCRQIAINKPKRLVIIDIYENTTYNIQNELIRKHKNLDLKVYIGSVRDKRTIDELINKEKPNVIFHAAAHKHVPLMEDSPKEAIKNNVFGTYNVAQAAINNDVEKFVFISTDKAVNPTNVMGASKRLCEMMIQAMDSISETDFVAVRFGNVLGSNGSVIPLFKKQIAEGGPVTVTHEEVIRYFMTIPEAVSLVIQAGAMANGGEIFILDMGKPVKILDLAEDVIRLSGFEPYTEIPIKIVGLRPGEKLFEELLMDEEGITATKHDKIFVALPSSIEFEKLKQKLDELYCTTTEKNNDDLKAHLKLLVPTYKTDN